MKVMDLEFQESVLQSDYDVKRTDLETEVCELEEKIAAGMESESLLKDLDCLLRVIGKTECGKQGISNLIEGSDVEATKGRSWASGRAEVSDPLKKRCAAAMAGKRRCYSLLRLFR
ncbi:hypothetical protein POTOM_056928 [Populus tomentosa]|uniref:Uncharacterized protein n=1 Tax=Populus tomentosa TaxID=118781 RepID=A0A8X7XW62_POPTO|nr:hypothetical protein POTOM_056928 [Populus tomentosa]